MSSKGLYERSLEELMIQNMGQGRPNVPKTGTMTEYVNGLDLKMLQFYEGAGTMMLTTSDDNRLQVILGERNGARDLNPEREVQHAGGKIDTRTVSEVCDGKKQKRVTEILEFDPKVTAARESTEEYHFPVTADMLKDSFAVYSTETNTGLACWLYLLFLDRSQEQELMDGFTAHCNAQWENYHAIKAQADAQGREVTEDERKTMPEMLSLKKFYLEDLTSAVNAFVAVDAASGKISKKRVPLTANDGSTFLLRKFQNFLVEILLRARP